MGSASTSWPQVAFSARGLVVQLAPRDAVWLFVDEGHPPTEVFWLPPEHEPLLPISELQAALVRDAAASTCPGLSDRARRQLRAYADEIANEQV